MVPWLQRHWPWVGMSSPGQSAQTPYISPVKEATLPHSPTHFSGSEAGVVAAHSFFPDRSLFLSIYPGNRLSLLLTHVPSIAELYTFKKHGSRWWSPYLFSFPSPIHFPPDSLGSITSEKRPEVQTQSLLSPFTMNVPWVGKDLSLPSEWSSHTSIVVVIMLGSFRGRTAFSGPHSPLTMLSAGTRKFYCPLISHGQR